MLPNFETVDLITLVRKSDPDGPRLTVDRAHLPSVVRSAPTEWAQSGDPITALCATWQGKRYYVPLIKVS